MNQSQPYIVVLGTAHSKSTPGKCSPDKRLFEWAYSREICRGVADGLNKMGVNCMIDIEDDEEISLTNRVRIVNAECDTYGKDNVIYISIHCNAVGDGVGWYNASGWSGWIYSACSRNSVALAECFYDAVNQRNLKVRCPVPDQHYWTSNFCVLKNTKCPAILTENFFMDGKRDLDFLVSSEGKQTIIDFHIEAIVNFLRSKDKF